MTGDETGRLIYLMLLGAMVASYFFVANRESFSKAFRQLMLWGLIFLGVIAGYGLWSDIRDDLIPRQAVIAGENRVEVPRAPDGHYYLTLSANGTDIDFVVDTGATDIVLSKADAERIGIDLDTLIYTGRANTANGVVRIAQTRLDTLNLGDIRDQNIRVSINEGELQTSLLGMAYLQRFETLKIENGRLILQR